MQEGGEENSGSVALTRKLRVYLTGSGKALMTHKTTGSSVYDVEIRFWKQGEADSQVSFTVIQRKVREER